MPYDPRLVSEGGNRGKDEEFSRKAPFGKFRVIEVDTFEGTDFKEGDYDTLQEARDIITKATKGESMLRMYIYNDQGINVGSAGSF